MKNDKKSNDGSSSSSSILKSMFKKSDNNNKPDKNSTIYLRKFSIDGGTDDIDIIQGNYKDIREIKNKIENTKNRKLSSFESDLYEEINLEVDLVGGGGCGSGDGSIDSDETSNGQNNLSALNEMNEEYENGENDVIIANEFNQRSLIEKVIIITKQNKILILSFFTFLKRKLLFS